MRAVEIIDLLRNYFSLALVALVFLGLFVLIWYFTAYRKSSKTNKSLPVKQLVISALFIGYVIMVMGVTILDRGTNFDKGINLSFFITYKEAWYNFSVRHWQFVLLNIVMFVPFGILFPLIQPPFKKVGWTVGMALLFTLSIEIFQLVTGVGNFEVDDLFNNLLGALIGYGIVKAFFSMKEKRIKLTLLYLTPLMVMILGLGITFTYYHFKEFGNLSIVPVQKLNMSQAAIQVDPQFDDHRKTVPIYKAPSFTKSESDEFVESFFKRINIDSSNMEIISYSNEGVYWIREERSHNIWFHSLDGSYSYKDFSSFDENMEKKDVQEDILQEDLLKFGIIVPDETTFQKKDIGTYEWTIDKNIQGNHLVDGSLSVSYYNDDTVKEIDNQLITYDKVRDIEMKSEKEAYQEILDGKFQSHSEGGKVERLHIYKVELDYFLDTKGFYQPVYAFEAKVDGMSQIIRIPGI